MAQGAGQGQGVGQDTGQVTVGLQFKNLRADVGMEPIQPGPGTASQVAQHGLQLVGIEAEFAVQMTGADVLVGMAFDPRGETQHQAHGAGVGRGDGAEQFKIEPVVNHHGDAVAQGQLQFLPGLVVAMQHDAIGGHAPLQGCQQFAGGDRIQPQSLGGHQGRDRQGAVGFGGIESQGGTGIGFFKGLAIGPAGSPQGGFIQHVERRAVVPGQVAQQASAHQQPLLGIQAGTDRRQVAIGTARIDHAFIGTSRGGCPPLRPRCLRGTERLRSG